MDVRHVQAGAAADVLSADSRLRVEAVALLTIAHRAVRLNAAAERAVAACHGPHAGASARECARLLARFYRLRGELAALPLTGPLPRLRGDLDTVLLCHQFYLHQAALSGRGPREPADLGSGLGLQGEWLRDLRDEILEYVPRSAASPDRSTRDQRGGRGER